MLANPALDLFGLLINLRFPGSQDFAVDFVLALLLQLFGKTRDLVLCLAA